MTEQRYCKRLIEVDLPIKRISEHARREKSIRHGHISTLHGYWARRPLAACRAVLCATLWLDPADDLCPNQLKQETARLLKEFRDRRGGKKRDLNDSIQLREALFDFIVDFSNLYYENPRSNYSQGNMKSGYQCHTLDVLLNPMREKLPVGLLK